MKVKIKSDGTIDGTTIIDAGTGEVLENVRALTISADAETREFRVFLELHGGPETFDLEVEADAETGE
jgi:hypothetical protein